VLFETQKSGKHTNHSVSITSIDFPEKDLIIDPYLLGVWLGDGDGAKATSRISSKDMEIINAFSQEYNINKIAGENCDWGVSAKESGQSLLVQLREMNLLHNKHIPYLYLRGSRCQRLALLQGLMDTDGTVDKETQLPSFTNTNKQLAIDTLELIRSLGFHARLTHGKAKLNGEIISDKWDIHFSASECVFRLSRKRVLQKTTGFRKTYGNKYITNIKKTDSVPVKCIAVNAPSKMYLCSKGFTPTHNTTLVSTVAKEFGRAIRFAFCALSGRAASVLGRKLQDQGIQFEDGGHYCGTIHRLIYRPIENEEGEVVFWAKKEALEYDIIVLDEASMVSEDIFRDLSSYGIDILAVGDHGQLPPIEGRFSLMSDPILRLEKIHRQAADNPIINLSMEVREHGKIPKGYKDNEHIRIVRKNEYINLLKGIYQGIKDPEQVLDTAVLCYKNDTRTKLNIMIRNMVFGNICQTPLANDIVICLRNAVNARKEPLYNGFRGYIISGVTDFDEDFYEGRLRFPYEGFETYVNNMLKYQFGFSKTFSSFGELEQFGMEVKHWSEVGLLFDYGYAMTTHKFQGSQVNNVVLFNERPAPVSEDNYRRWLYTSVTRATTNLTVIL
jgi:exodeoxyribonuclease V